MTNRNASKKLNLNIKSFEQKVAPVIAETVGCCGGLGGGEASKVAAVAFY